VRPHAENRDLSPGRLQIGSLCNQAIRGTGNKLSIGAQPIYP
jgi:hypothetical protein